MATSDQLIKIFFAFLLLIACVDENSYEKAEFNAINDIVNDYLKRTILINLSKVPPPALPNGELAKEFTMVIDSKVYTGVQV